MKRIEKKCFEAVKPTSICLWFHSDRNWREIMIHTGKVKKLEL